MERKMPGFRLILAVLMSVVLIMSSAGVTTFAGEPASEPDAAVMEDNDETSPGEVAASDYEESFEDADLSSEESSDSGVRSSSDEISYPEDDVSSDEVSYPEDDASSDEASYPEDDALSDEVSYSEDGTSSNEVPYSDDMTLSEDGNDSGDGNGQGTSRQEDSGGSEEDTSAPDEDVLSDIPADEEELSEEAGYAREDGSYPHMITVDSGVRSYLDVNPVWEAYPGDTVTVTARPTTGTVTASITAKMSSDDSFLNEDYLYDVPGVRHPDRDTIEFEMPNANVYLTAAFTGYDQVRVFICDMEGGTVTADQYVADMYSDVYLTVCPDNGYRYVEDSLTITEPDNPSPISNTQAYLSQYPEGDGSYRLDLGRYSVNVTAEFEALPVEETFAVTLPENVEHGTLTANCSEAAEGWTVTLTARPEAQSYYMLESLTVTTQSGDPVEVEIQNASNGTYTFNMPGEPVSVSAVFAIPSYMVTPVSEDSTDLGNKILDTAVFDNPVDYGDSVYIKLLVKDGGKLDSLTARGDSGTEYPIRQSDDFYVFTMPAEPVTLTAVFGFVDYIFTADDSVRGTLTVATDGDPVYFPTVVHMNETVTVINTLTETDGVIVDHFTFSFYDYQSNPRTVNVPPSQNGMAFSRSFTLNWPSDVVVSAVYAAANAVRIEKSGNGSITADKGLAVTGDSVTLTIEPESGWGLTKLTVVNGDAPIDFSENADGTVTFEMPEGGVTVTGVFISTMVPYINAAGSGDTATTSFVRSFSTEWSGQDVWFAVTDDVTIESRVMVSGDVNLILCDGATLTARLGIGVPEGSSLTVWVQENGTGALIADVYENALPRIPNYAAIGGTGENGSAGEVTIYGGHLMLDGGIWSAAIGGAYKGGFTSVAIHGGTIKLNLNDGTGPTGSGIGGGFLGSSDGSITITGGEVTAKPGGWGDAAIGGPGASIEITGGSVTGTASGAKCGIGGKGAAVTISGGTVSGNAGLDSSSTGIGGESAEVNISGGIVSADGGSAGTGLGGKSATVNITGGTITAVDSQYYGGCFSLGGDNCKTYLDWDERRPVTTLNVHQFGGKVYLLCDFIEENNEELVFSATGESTSWSDLTQLQDKTLVALPVVKPAVTITGVTGTFNDKIKLNYYFDIPAPVSADEGAYVTLTNESTGKSVTLQVKDVDLIEGRGYKFSIPLVAKEAGDTITARVYNGRGNALPIKGNLRDNDYTETGVQYSLMKYFTWLETSGSTDKEKKVGAAAKDYCSAVQIYFDYNADGLAVSSAADDVTAEMLSSYIAGRTGTLPEGVSIRGISAMLESDNTFRLYLAFKDVDPADFTFAIDGADADLKERADGTYYLALDTGVSSNRLQDVHTYSVSYGTDTYTISASVLTYARSCAIKNQKTESDLGKTLYLYNVAAVEAFGQ